MFIYRREMQKTAWKQLSLRNRSTVTLRYTRPGVPWPHVRRVLRRGCDGLALSAHRGQLSRGRRFHDAGRRCGRFGPMVRRVPRRVDVNEIRLMFQVMAGERGMNETLRRRIGASGSSYSMSSSVLV